MVTFKKLLLLMSIAPSVAIVAMDSKSVTSPVNTNANNNNNNNNNSKNARNVDNPSTSLINPTNLDRSFPAQTFNTDGYYNEFEWDVLNTQDSSRMLASLRQKIMMRKDPISHWRDKSTDSHDSQTMIAIPDTDNPKEEKKNEARTFSIEYKDNKKKGPRVIIREYKPNHPRGKPQHKRSLEVTDDRLVVATTVYKVTNCAAYADDANQIRIYGSRGWGDLKKMVHAHDAFEEKYNTEGKDSAPTISSLSFIDPHVLVVRDIPNKCVALIHVGSDGRFNHIKCFEAPQEGTGYVTGSVLGRQYKYYFAWEKQQKDKESIDNGIVRTYPGIIMGNEYVDRFDRISLDVAINHLSDEQVLFIGFMSFIARMNKENSSALMISQAKELYKGPMLKTFSTAAQQQFKSVIEDKAKLLNFSLK